MKYKVGDTVIVLTHRLGKCSKPGCKFFNPAMWRAIGKRGRISRVYGEDYRIQFMGLPTCTYSWSDCMVSKSSKVKKMPSVPITLGSDPELAIVRTDGNYISANDIIHNGTHLQFGTDGAGSPLEIRPKPVTDPQDAVNEIKRILELNKKKYPQIFANSLKAAHRSMPIGGHLHFGHLELQHNDELNTTLAQNLDFLLAVPCLFLENKALAVARRYHSSYGRLSDWRGQDWGMEYRTLASFVASRQLTRCIFYLSHAIADATIYHNWKAKSHKISREAFALCDTSHLKPLLPEIFEDQKNLPKYKEDRKYRRAIDLFRQMVKRGDPAFSTEIKAGWSVAFDIENYMKVPRIETLIEKVTRYLTTQEAQPQTLDTHFIEASGKDLFCPQIAFAVSLALNKTLGKVALKRLLPPRTIRIIGIRQENGNKILVNLPRLKEKKRKQVLATLWQVASSFKHTTKIEEIAFTRHIRHYTVGYGRRIREENLLMLEVMTFILSLFANPSLYKHTEGQGKNKKRLYTTTRKLNKALANLKPTKGKDLTQPILCIPGTRIQLPDIFDLRQSVRHIINRVETLPPEDKLKISQTVGTLYGRLLKKENTIPTRRELCYCRFAIDLNFPAYKLCTYHIVNSLKNIIARSFPVQKKQVFTYRTQADLAGFIRTRSTSQPI